MVGLGPVFQSTTLRRQDPVVSPDKSTRKCQEEEEQEGQQGRQQEKHEVEVSKNGVELVDEQQPALTQKQDNSTSLSPVPEQDYYIHPTSSLAPSSSSVLDSNDVKNINNDDGDDDDSSNSSRNKDSSSISPADEPDGDSIHPLVSLTQRRQQQQQRQHPRRMSTPQPMLSVSTPVRGRYFNLQSPLLISSPPPVLSPSYSTTSASSTSTTSSSIDLDLRYLRRQSRVEERIRQFETKGGGLAKRRYSADCTRNRTAPAVIIQKRTFGFKPIFTEWEKRIAAASASASSSSLSSQ